VAVERGAKRSTFCTAARQPPTSATRGTDYLIIAADSLVFFAGKTYGKPKTKNEAKKYLQMFSGKAHEFLTGLCIINTKTNKLYQASQKTKVKFEKLRQKEIDDYIRLAPVTSFAGAYSLEEAGAEIIRSKIKIIGSETNVLGLPVEKLIPILEELGISS
jgi:septum formation protein